MRKTKIREWTCDKCGRTFEGSRVFRPYRVRSAKICVDLEYNMQYRRKYDFCPECANGLASTIDRYVRGEE